MHQWLNQSWSLKNIWKQGKHTCLGGNSSSSFVDAGGSFELSYGDGSHVLGHLARDTLNVAGLTLKGHTFGVASQESEGLVNATISPYDGILGLGKAVHSLGQGC